MPTPIYVVDAFTDRAFAGNAAAVCLLSDDRPDAWMQSIAAEMNLAETAFLLESNDGYNLRWFTPTVEVDLCGHATIASAHVLWETGRILAGAAARFRTRSGLLTAARAGDWIELDFPSTPPEPCDPPGGLDEFLGAAVVATGRSRFDLLAALADEAAVRSLAPDIARLGTLPVRGVIATARADSGRPYDFVSRFFAPAAGIIEDPATGSSHCCLAPYWQQRLGKSQMVGYQASRRGGTVRVAVCGDRVVLGGKAVMIVKGELVAPDVE